MSLNNDHQAISSSIDDENTLYPVVDLHITCSQLKKLDLAGQSDPMVVVFMNDEKSNMKEVGRTEVMWNSPNPIFVKSVRIPYIFEKYQPIVFKVYDCDSEDAPLSKHELIGTVETNLQTLVSNQGNTNLFHLMNSARSGELGTMNVIAEQPNNSNMFMEMKVSAKKIRKMRTFSKNCPYVVVSRKSATHHWIPIYKTEVIQKAYQCTWNLFSIKIGNYPLRFTLVDNHVSKEDVEIGYFETTFEELQASGSGRLFECRNNSGKSCGFVSFSAIKFVRHTSFLDYLNAGIRLNLVTAIDYTASNREPSNPKSLHYIGDKLNQYERSIRGVGEILCPYDSDQNFAVYGFGARLPEQPVSHCFPLTMSENPCVYGLEGIIEAYHNSLSKVQLSGPTFFHEIIHAASQLATAAFEHAKTYTVLLIMTDGVINDLTQTVDEIVEASKTALSIIIVGVGNADFTQMEKLDADKTPLIHSTNHQRMNRDIVQFVPFRDFADDVTRLTASVLSEIPKQVQSYCETRGIFIT